MRKIVIIAFLSMLGFVTLSDGTPVSANTQKVEICHRTRSVTNPYVRINVSDNAVSNGNGKHGGNSHDLYSPTLYPSGKPVPNVFDPTKTYPANEKMWGDIIAFTYTGTNIALSGNAAVVAGLNNVSVGAQIFAGTAPYTGLCKTMTAREYYDVEVGEGGQNPADVLAEMNEAEADEWATAKAACPGQTFVGCPADTLGAPSQYFQAPAPNTQPPCPSSGNAPPASVEPKAKVTICHRTHSVTNPYVRITVSQNAVGNGTGKHGGAKHDQYSTILFPNGKPVPNVFNPAVNYNPPTEKKWGDIIAWTDVEGNPLVGGAAAVAGLNNTGIGAAIFNGTGRFADTCKAKSAREFYDIETREGGRTPADVLDDMEDADSEEWADAKKSCGGSFKGCSPDKLGSPSAQKITRKIRGTVWIDANRDGLKVSGERVLANYPLVVLPGPGNMSGQRFNTTTDDAGNYEIPDVPAGNWIVRPAALPNSDYEQVFDTDSGVGRADWKVGVTVPAVGEGVADFAAALKPAAVANGTRDDLGSTPVTQRLRGSLWVDANRDGRRGPQEKILANHPVIVTPGPGNKSNRVFEVVTDPAGNYELPNIPAGIWIVKPAPLSNTDYEPVFDSDSGTRSPDWEVRASVPAGGEGVADFAAALTPAAVADGSPDDLGENPVSQQLRGSLWIDANRDGIRGVRERILANYPLVVLPGPGNSSGRTFSALTDAAGNYAIRNIPAGNWIVRPAGLPGSNHEPVFDSDSGRVSPDWIVAVNIPSGGEGIADFAAALTRRASNSGARDTLGSPPSDPKLRGSIWVDANRDGSKDQQERILPNYPIVISPGPGNASDRTYTVYTDGAGNYQIGGLPPGKWIVRPGQLASPNYERSFDSDSLTSQPDWVVVVDVPAVGEAVADFAATLTAAALASGAPDDLGSAPIAPQLPVTGPAGSDALLAWALALIVGGLLVMRGRRPGNGRNRSVLDSSENLSA